MLRLSFTCLLLLGFLTSYSNDILISNLVAADEAGNPGYATLTFDVRWENSWRTSRAPDNWDAAWIFAKYRTSPGDGWQHVILSGAASAPAGATVEVKDGIGTMLHASSDFAGTADYRNLALRWDLHANGLSRVSNVEVRIYGIEMVYIPEGAFYIGSGTGGTEKDRFYAGGTADQQPFLIDHSGPIAIGNQSGKLFYDDLDDRGSMIEGPVPAEFPTGYDAFYLMKYELSQQQYVDFFNTLTYDQQLLHDITDANGKNTDEDRRRNCISWGAAFGEEASTTAPHVPVGYVSTRDMFAYLDWAALRPMTEMEFEKACRGPEPPLADEYAWGNNNIVHQPLSPSNVNAKDEVVSNRDLSDLTAGYAAYQHSTTQTTSGKGPYRCGIFSASLPVNVDAVIQQAIRTSTFSTNNNGQAVGNGGQTGNQQGNNGNGAGNTYTETVNIIEDSTEAVLSALQYYRILTGAGYYGNMELSGNQWEGVITVTHSDGLTFTNTHGDGTLTAEGLADVSSWPTTVDGVGIKGGRSDNTENFLCVADRSYATVIAADYTSRFYWLQFRGVRGL